MEKIVEAEKIKEANRIIFDRNSLTYSKRRRIRFDKKTALWLIQRYENAMKKEFKPVERFLDLGCGNGLLLLNLTSLGFISKTYGIDISAGMLKECKNNANNLGINVFLAQGDVDYSPFKSDSFDLIIGHAILHHLPDIKMVFNEVHRLLRPEGICIFTEPSEMGNRIISTFMYTIWSFLLFLRRITKSQIENLVEVNTFTPKKLEIQAKLSGFTTLYTKAFAGFASRIFYWIMDPISQRISSKYYHLIIDKIINTLFILDKQFFRLFIPQGWFDEIFIFMQK